MTASRFRAAGRLAASGIGLFVFGVACAEGTPNEHLSEGTLSGAGVSSGEPSAGSGGTMTAAGTGGGGGLPSSNAGSGGVPTPTGGAGASAGGSGGNATAGTGAGGGGSGGGGSGGGGAGGGGSGGGGSGGMAGSGGGGSGGFRYAKLVATSEQSGAVWSSVAELNLLTTGSATITRGGWSIMADSEETDDEQAPATAAIDGDVATFWHTAWEPAPNDVNDPPLPHSLTIDMKSPQTVTGFSYLPRQTGTHGRIKDWEFYLSTDGVTWGTAVKKGTFPDGTALQNVTF
ncbi:MAG TPA: discoidin domain-containing protein [Polyangiaceae bacterium]|nr:discoidin domain-containing protein [Polyangiaceae bacterium]